MEIMKICESTGAKARRKIKNNENQRECRRKGKKENNLREYSS